MHWKCTENKKKERKRTIDIFHKISRRINFLYVIFYKKNWDVTMWLWTRTYYHIATFVINASFLLGSTESQPLPRAFCFDLLCTQRPAAQPECLKSGQSVWLLLGGNKLDRLDSGLAGKRDRGPIYDMACQGRPGNVPKIAAAFLMQLQHWHCNVSWDHWSSGFWKLPKPKCARAAGADHLQFSYSKHLLLHDSASPDSSRQAKYQQASPDSAASQDRQPSTEQQARPDSGNKAVKE